MTNDELKEILELSKRRDSLLNQIAIFDSYLASRNDFLEGINYINSKIGVITEDRIKEAEILYKKRESLLRNLDIVDKYFDKDDIVATIGLGIGEDSLLEFLYINDPKSVLKVVRNNLLIEINDINKQIDKL